MIKLPFIDSIKKFFSKEQPKSEQPKCWNKKPIMVTFNGKRVRQARMVWEQHHGAIPKNYVITHTDGDVHNCHIGNLECVTRAELLRRNRT